MAFFHGLWSVDICKTCVDDGFTSVMIDASHDPFDVNVSKTKEVVEYAHKHNVTVKADLCR
ncbi:MAG: class II fructose-bisphosphate aldolase [Phycisphaerae bacterium]|nr:class II fructose-bisphosphate aldolase [Phycisphaerae bacterium]